jgi:hypothetical protein
MKAEGEYLRPYPGVEQHFDRGQIGILADENDEKWRVVVTFLLKQVIQSKAYISQVQICV